MRVFTSCGTVTSTVAGMNSALAKVAPCGGNVLDCLRLV